MDILTQNTIGLQEIFGNVMDNCPLIIVDDKAELYFLIKKLSEKMEQFLYTGKTDTEDLHVFEEDDEQQLLNQWEHLGFKCQYRSQSVEYLYQWVTITYLQICNPVTGLKISLFPWFLIPGRPFPAFVYVYSSWYYYNTRQKSMEQTAFIVRKVFGLSNFHKSTVCRNVSAMEQLFGNIQLDAPLATTKLTKSCVSDRLEQVTELLQNCPTVDALEEIYKIKVVKTLSPINHSETMTRALSLIPPELSNVTKDSTVEKTVYPKRRKGSKRLRKKRSRPTKVKPDFVESQVIRQIREDFITECKGIVLQMAVTYHSFFI